MKRFAATFVFVSLGSSAIADKKPTPKPMEGPARTGDSTTKSNIKNLRIKEINDKDKIFTAVAADRQSVPIHLSEARRAEGRRGCRYNLHGYSRWTEARDGEQPQLVQVELAVIAAEGGFP